MNEKNIEIFEDTKRLVEGNERIKASVAKSIAGQKLYCDSEWTLPDVSTEALENAESAKIVVSKKRTLAAAAGYKGKVAVHNFASATNPGGGVTRGSSAQEECICRCTGLYFCLSTPKMMQAFYYPHRNAHNLLNNDDVIFTPGVTVFKTDTESPVLMDEKDWYDVEVITCAAPNLREQPGNRFNPGSGEKPAKVTDRDVFEIHKRRLRRILDVAALNGAEVVILGAFGCGAFRNKPEIVARAAKEVVADYTHFFKTIEFAVYCPPRDDTNYQVFKRVFGTR